MDTSKVLFTQYMFSGCSSLVEAPQIDTSNVENMQDMFSGCGLLTKVPDMDVSKARYMQDMFSGCSSLTDGNVRLIRKDGTKPPNHFRMIYQSGLTREPFFRPDGTPID